MDRRIIVRANSTSLNDDFARRVADCSGIRDGLPLAACAALSGATDFDNDHLPERIEVCKWGTSDKDTDSDGDGLTDCLEIVDVNGDAAKAFLTDLIPFAKAVQLPGPAFGKDGDFDYNGDNALTFLGDLIPVAKLIQLAPASGGCATTPAAPKSVALSIASYERMLPTISRPRWELSARDSGTAAVQQQLYSCHVRISV